MSKKILALLAGAALVLAGCSSSTEETTATETAAANPNADIKICVYTHGDGGSFWSVAQKGAEAAAADLGVTLHHLATWWDVLEFAKSCGQFDPTKLQEIEKFLHDPAGWSKAHGGVSVAAE